jgi:hypothetical protein
MSRIEVKRKPLRMPRKHKVTVEGSAIFPDRVELEVTARCVSEACKKAEAMVRKDPDKYLSKPKI